MAAITINDILVFLTHERIEYSSIGNQDTIVSSFSALNDYKDGGITWIKNLSLVPAMAFQKRYTAVVVQESGQDISRLNAECIILSPASKTVFFGIVKKFFSNTVGLVYERSNTFVSKSAHIAENVKIGDNCYICDDVIIESGTVISNNVSIECRAHIGKECRIFSGVVLGSAGFGIYKDAKGNNCRVEHVGGVQIGDHVEIGDHCVINRGTIGDTTIGDYTFIDALTQIPHNVRIGSNCLILGGIGGSCNIGNDSYIAPSSYVLNHVNVGDHCMVNCGVVLSKSLPDGHVAHKDRFIKVDYYKLLNLK